MSKKTSKKTEVKKSDEVQQFLQSLDHPLKTEIIKLRAIILASDPQITEQIKWKAPSFCYNGDDRVTFKLYPPDRIQLIFHRGVKVREDDFRFQDDSGLLEWVANDRATTTFRSMEEVNVKEESLTDVVRRWMLATG